MTEQSYQLYVRRGPMPGELYVLTLPTLIAGRDPLADILIRDPEVSRNHARFVLSENGYEIQDMGSTNGTFINGTPLRGEPHLLTAGELITLGSNVVLEYQIMEVEANDPLATMLSQDASAAPDLPLPGATGRLSDEDSPADFSAFELFNDEANGSDRDFDREPSLDALLSSTPSTPEPMPQTAYFEREEMEEEAPQPRPRPQPPTNTPPPPAPKQRNTLLTILVIVLIFLIALCCFFLLLTVYFLQDAGLILGVLHTAV